MNTSIETVTNFVTTKLTECNTFESVTRFGHSGNGLGNATETLVYGVEENNLAGADIQHLNLEAKCSDVETSSLTTIFTNDPKINLMIPEEERAKKRPKGGMRSLMENFSQWNSEKGRYMFYYDLKIGKATNIGKNVFTLTRDDDNLWIEANGQAVTGWYTDQIMQSVKRKVGGGASAPDGQGSVVIAKGRSTLVDVNSNRHKHQIEEAVVYHGFRASNFLNALDDGTITVSLRAWGEDRGKTSMYIRNHGTGFRISQNNVSKLFDRQEVAFKL